MVSNEVTGAADISKRAFPKQDFAATQLPNLEASTLPPYCYTSPDFYKLEVEKIFLKEWLCVGRTDQVQKSGDFFSLDLLGQPLLDNSRREQQHTCVVQSVYASRNAAC